MILAQMLGPNSKEILPEEFLNKLAKIQSDEDMDKLVKAEFLPMVKIPSLMDKVNMDWLKLIRSREPMEQIQKYLLKNVRKFLKFFEKYALLGLVSSQKIFYCSNKFIITTCALRGV